MSKPKVISPTDRVIQLLDGRTLGYAEYGLPDGKVLFYFHGHPGSRLEARFLAKSATQAGIRLISVDRPGMGLSSFKAGRTVLDWPDDVIALAKLLEIHQFAVVGFSGGGPYAAACAYKIPDRLTACGIIAGVGKMSRFVSFLSMWLPWLVLPVTGRFFRDEQTASRSLRRFASRWPEPDQKSLLVPGIAEAMAASLVAGLNQGSRGPAHDGTLLGRSWGFNLEDIAFPKMYLWHGELDKEIPIELGRAVAARLAQCKATYYPGEGHISLIVQRGEEILATLLS